MASQATPDSVVSHWSTLIENFQFSPLAFYTAVEEAIRRREVPETTNSRVDYREGGMLSANREYLHVTRDRLVLDICGAPFGTGFFVSWWLAEPRNELGPVSKAVALAIELGLVALLIANAGIVLGMVLSAVIAFILLMVVHQVIEEGGNDDGYICSLPIIGWVYERLFRQSTYFRADTRDMFQQAVHNAVLEVIDTVTADRGIRALSEGARKPIMREFYARKAA